MAKVKLTSGRVNNFQCKDEKSQDFLWCSDVAGLAVRATPNSTTNRFIFQAKVKGKTMRVTIGKVSAWTIEEAKAEARRLQVEIDKGNDPRQQAIEKELNKLENQKAREDAEAVLKQRYSVESTTMLEAWNDYIKERSASKKDGVLEWGERHKEHLASFTQAGGVKIARGKRPDGTSTTRQGILYPLLNKRLIDLDTKTILSWLDKELSIAPTSTSKAFSVLRAFLTWCSKHESYSAIVTNNPCLTDEIKHKIPKPKVKENDSLRRAQIEPWFNSVRFINNPIISAYLQSLLLTGARRNELAALRWQDVDFKWKSLTIRDKVDGERTIPLTPYVEHLISPLARRNEYVFSSASSKSGRLEEPRNPHKRALLNASLPPLSLHGLRRSFGTLSEWVEVPAGIVAQIMGHKPSAIAEKHYIQRELDLLHLWHERIEAWILSEAGIKFEPSNAQLRVINNG